MRPLVLTLLLSFIPVAYQCHNKRSFIMLTHMLLLLFVGCKHHMDFVWNDFWHKTDRILCWSMIFHTAALNYLFFGDYLYWVCLIAVGVCHFLGKRCDNKDDCKRGWDNVNCLYPHMLMHVFASISICSLLSCMQ